MVLLDPTGFWNPITQILDQMVYTGFAPEFTRTILPKVSTADEAVKYSDYILIPVRYDTKTYGNNPTTDIY